MKKNSSSHMSFKNSFCWLYFPPILPWLVNILHKSSQVCDRVLRNLRSSLGGPVSFVLLRWVMNLPHAILLPLTLLLTVWSGAPKWPACRVPSGHRLQAQLLNQIQAIGSTDERYGCGCLSATEQGDGTARRATWSVALPLGTHLTQAC